MVAPAGSSVVVVPVTTVLPVVMVLFGRNTAVRADTADAHPWRQEQQLRDQQDGQELSGHGDTRTTAGNPSAHISQMNLGFRHDICAETLENPAPLTPPCRNDRGTQWVTATMTPSASISTARSSWSSTAPPSLQTPDFSPIANSTKPSH